MFRSLLKVTMVCAAVLSAVPASADPRSVLVDITRLRPYTSGTFFVSVSSAQLTTGASCTTVYAVKKDDPGAKNVIASILTAFALGSKVQIETPTATGCSGFGTPIQSVFIPA